MTKIVSGCDEETLDAVASVYQLAAPSLFRASSIKMAEAAKLVENAQRDVYEDKLGYVPSVYVLMHANTGRFGNNREVSDTNERWICDLFAMNFNREGYCFNQRNSSIYDLTRMQPQPYWPVNHLLMRIKYDINQPITFEKGEKRHQEDWENTKGAAEIKEEKYILTTLPEGEVLSRLNSKKDFRDARELYREKIAVILGQKIPSKEEMKREAEVTENEAFARYADSPAEAKEYLARAEYRKQHPAASVEDGAEPDTEMTSFHERSSHDIDIAFKDDALTVTVDGKPAVEDLSLGNTQRGGILLGADWKSDAWSQRNLADDVYDGVFDKFTVLSNPGKDEKDEKVLFTMQYTGLEHYEHRAKAKKSGRPS